MNMLLAWIVAITLLIVIYGPGFAEGFFPIDDQSLINIPQLKYFDWAAIKSIFQFGNHIDYYPLRDLTYVVDWQLGGDLSVNGTMYRLQNLVWLILTAMMLYKLLRNLNISLFRAHIVSLTWLLLPVHAESIMWGAARKDILGMFWFVFAAYFALEAFRVERKKYINEILATLGFVFSILSKATFVNTIFFIIFFILIYRRKLLKDKFKTTWFLLTAAIAASSVMFQTFVYSSINPMALYYSWGYRVQALLAAIGRSVLGWVWPVNNGIDVVNWGDWVNYNSFYIYWGILFSTLFVIYLVWIFKKNQQILIALFFILIGVLSCTPGFNPLHRNFYSVRYFEPILLVFVVSASIVIRINKQYKKVCIAALLLFLFLVNFVEFGRWDSNVEIAKSAMAITPDSLSVQNVVLNNIMEQIKWGRASQDDISLSHTLILNLLKKCHFQNPEQVNTQCFFFLLNNQGYDLSVYGIKEDQAGGVSGEDLKIDFKLSAEKLGIKDYTQFAINSDLFNKSFDIVQRQAPWFAKHSYYPSENIRLYHALQLCELQDNIVSVDYIKKMLDAHLLEQKKINLKISEIKDLAFKKWVFHCILGQISI